jgi:hypothetical protein
MTPAEETRERIATLAVTLRAFTGLVGAEAAVLLLDRGDGGLPFVVDCPAEGLVTLAEGEQLVELDAARLAAEPLPLPVFDGVAAGAPLRAGTVRAELAALTAGGSPSGAAGGGAAAGGASIAPLARALRELTGGFPGRSVVSATFATDDPDRPLQLTARAGDPLVVSLGDEQAELPPGWPS